MLTHKTPHLQNTLSYQFYDSSYHGMYVPSYDIGFVFYDEDELENSMWEEFKNTPSNGQTSLLH